MSFNKYLIDCEVHGKSQRERIKSNTFQLPVSELRVLPGIIDITCTFYLLFVCCLLKKKMIWCVSRFIVEFLHPVSLDQDFFFPLKMNLLAAQTKKNGLGQRTEFKMLLFMSCLEIV